MTFNQMSKRKIRIFCFFATFIPFFFCNFAELLKRLACEKLVFQQISFAKLETANFTVCPLQEKSGRLQLTLKYAQM